jgi:neutral ceramidase
VTDAQGTWEAGLGKADITVFEPGMCLFGWGQTYNVAVDVAAPLFARALVVRDPRSGGLVAYACADLGFISQHLRHRVLARLAGRGLGEHQLMLTCTHTHSGPSGYSAYLFYAVTGPGFSRRVTEALADGIALAITRALDDCAPARLWLHEGDVSLTDPASFNRSLEAYNTNPDVEPVPAGRTDEAVDRRMTVLRVEDLRGRPRGLVSWFPVHGTSVHADNTRIHPDNKGEAASRCEALAEAALGPSPAPFVAIFAQEAAGDVTPNFRWCARRRLLIGRYDDDFESAAFNGEIQARYAWRLCQRAPEVGALLSGAVAGRIRYADYGDVDVDPAFTDGRPDQRSAPASLGLGFALGTAEGPGPAFAATAYSPAIARLVGRRRALHPHDDWRAMHGGKARFFDLGHGVEGRILAWLSTRPPMLRYLPDARMQYYADVLEHGGIGRRPWVPDVLPVHVLRLGDLVIVGVPFEPTTVAGRRLRATTLGALASAGVTRAVINGYANAYASYLTTHEEYRLQRYEGASTLFGQWTLGALRTELRGLAAAWGPATTSASPDDLGRRPDIFDETPLLPGHAAR